MTPNQLSRLSEPTSSPREKTSNTGAALSAAPAFSALACVFALMIALITSALCAETFSSPEKLTDGSRRFQLSRTANSVMAFDSAGRLHIAYWSGRITTSPATPSFVYYQSWSAAEGWSPREEIDNSEVAGDHVGGRHPSLAVTPNDDVWVVWHDHRHSTAGGNWIDNTEIYADFKPAAGSFSSSDIRVTNTTAGHFGDNSYTPKIAAHSSGRLSLIWYDYTANATVSDLYLEHSDLSGAFNFADAIGGARATFEPSRSGSPEFTVPDLAIAPDGTRHLVWTGGQGPGVDLYYGSAAAESPAVSEQLLIAGAADFFDPPHIAAAPNGDIWIAFGDDRVVGAEDLTLLRKRAGESSFDPEFVLSSPAFRQTAPDLEIDSAGRVHLVWVDERDGAHVYYGVFDPATETLIGEQQLTEISASWERPTLALDAFENAYILFEQSSGIASGDIWFVQKANAAAHWRDYE
jgi:hypothetical protein